MPEVTAALRRACHTRRLSLEHGGREHRERCRIGAGAVAGWLASPEHCANIMTAGFRQMGVAFAVPGECGSDRLDPRTSAHPVEAGIPQGITR